MGTKGAAGTTPSASARAALPPSAGCGLGWDQSCGPRWPFAFLLRLERDRGGDEFAPRDEG